MNWTVCAFYRFVAIADTEVAKQGILDFCADKNVCGTILIAPEGINATIAAAPKEDMDAIVGYLDEAFGIRQGEVKFSHASKKPFNRFKVRPKKEIITMRAPEADPTKQVGTYVAPEEWNALLDDPEVVVLDTRNDYETKIGMFDGAVDPDTETFTQFADYVEENLDPKKNKKVAMYCTGGIRCEKASSYMLAHGFEEVYHLKGGILKYLECIPADQSKWKGECFVFDKRVAVGHGLEEGGHTICHGCREPLSAEDLEDPSYEVGVSCAHCIDTLTPARVARLRERHKHYRSVTN